MKYEILGPLRVIDETNVSFISARKIETILAALLIRSDQVVTFDQLKAEIWGECLPLRATAALHVYISQLRKFLHRPGRDSPIVTLAPGYLLRQGTDEIDFLQYQNLINQGRAFVREGRHGDACASFEEALGLWRGRVVDDMHSGPIVDSFITWLTESRLECSQMLIESQLRLGHHREIVGYLYSLTAENPFHEVFYRQLMLALYRSERRADALRVYQTARKTLKDELGLEPCRSLRELQGAILASDDRIEICS